MEGVLDKWTNMFGGYQKRYLILKGEIVYYCEEKGLPFKGKLHLLVCTINDLADEECKFEIHTGSCFFYFKAETAEEKNEWIKALRLAKIHADNNFKKHQLLENKDDFIFLSNDIKEFPDKIKSLYSNYESLHNLLTSSQSEIMNIQMNKNGDIYKLKELNEDELKTSQNNIKLLNNLIDNFKEFNSSLINMTKFLNFNSHNNLGNSDTSNTNNTPINNNVVYDNQNNNQIQVVRSGMNKNLLLDSISKQDKDVIEHHDQTFYEADDSFELNSNSQNKVERKNTNKSLNQTPNTQLVSVNNPFYDEVYDKMPKRNRLPNKRIELNINVWGILKDAIGKDLNKFCVPVYFNEPISMLQRFCEVFQYADLMNKAVAETNQYKRLALVGAFNVSSHALNPDRTLKFFNPLLFETYEYIDTKLGFRFFAEQVSHHPAISACYVEGKGYNFYSNSHSKQQFVLTKGALEVDNVGKSFVNLTNTGDLITFNKPKVRVKGIILGKMFVDFFDNAIVTNHTTGDVLEMKFYSIDEPKKGDQGIVKGKVKDYTGQVKCEIEGSWLSHLDIIDENGKRERIWSKFLTDSYDNYFFTDFSSNLNNLTDELKAQLPPTDSRLRPDQRALENHDYDLAASEKHRLEEKQRKARKENEKKKNYKHTPNYFTESYDDMTGDLVYVYNKKYWKDRKERNFDHFPDIF